MSSDEGRDSSPGFQDAPAAQASSPRSAGSPPAEPAGSSECSLSVLKTTPVVPETQNLASGFTYSKPPSFAIERKDGNASARSVATTSSQSTRVANAGVAVTVARPASFAFNSPNVGLTRSRQLDTSSSDLPASSSTGTRSQLARPDHSSPVPVAPKDPFIDSFRRNQRGIGSESASIAHGRAGNTAIFSLPKALPTSSQLQTASLSSTVVTPSTALKGRDLPAAHPVGFLLRNRKSDSASANPPSSVRQSSFPSSSGATTAQEGASTQGGPAPKKRKAASTSSFPSQTTSVTVGASGESVIDKQQAASTPSAKRRKSNSREGPVMHSRIEELRPFLSAYLMQTFEDVIGEKDAKIDTLADDLSATKKLYSDVASQLSAIEHEKQKWKRDASSSVKSALQKISSELRDLSQAKQSLLASVKDLRPPPTQDELRALHQTIEGLRADVHHRYLNKDGDYSLERIRESSIGGLKEAQDQLQKAQSVNSLLREQLETKSGELVEARDRACRLEQLQLGYVKSQLDIEAVREAGRQTEESLRLERDAARKAECDALLKVAELEESWRGRLLDCEERLKEVNEISRVLDEEKQVVQQRATTLEGQLASVLAARDDYARAASTAEADLTALRQKYEIEAKQMQAAHEKTVLSLEERLSEAEVKLSDIPSLQSALAQARIDLKTSQETAVDRSESLEAMLDEERQSLVDLKQQMTQAQSDSASTLSTVKNSHARRLEQLQGEAQELKNQAIEASSREKTLHEELASLRRQLSEAQALHKNASAADSQEAQELRARETELRSSISRLQEEGKVLHEAMSGQQSTLASIEAERDAAIKAEQAGSDEIQRLRTELATARNKLESALGPDHLLEQCQEQHRVELEKQAKESYANFQNLLAREKASLSNELKRAHNRTKVLEERNRRLLTDVANLKGGRIIDPHIASSSSPGESAAGDISKATQEATHSSQDHPPAQANAQPDAVEANSGSSSRTFASLTAIDLEALSDADDVEGEPSQEVGDEFAQDARAQPEPIVVPVKTRAAQSESPAAGASSRTSASKPVVRATRRTTLELQERERATTRLQASTSDGRTDSVMREEDPIVDYLTQAADSGRARRGQQGVRAPAGKSAPTTYKRRK